MFDVLPNIEVAVFDLSLAAGASSTLVAGVVTKVIYCVRWNVDVASNAAASIALEDSASTGISRVSTNQASTASQKLLGAPGGNGNGIRLRNVSGVASGAIVGSLLYLGPV